MRTFSILGWLLRVQVVLGLVQYVGLFVGFAWPPQVWAMHRLIAVVAPVVALVAFRRRAWTRSGLPTPNAFEPGVRVAARLALLAPLALGVCFSIHIVGGIGWITAHIGLAVAALFVIERGTADLRARVATPERRGEVSGVGGTASRGRSYASPDDS